MPSYRAPGSDSRRSVFLVRARTTGAQDREAGRNYISQATLDWLIDLSTRFETAHNVVPEKLGERVREVEERNIALNLLKTYLRDLWEVLRRRVRRLNQPAGVLGHYQLLTGGISPNPSTSDEWLALAGRVIEGDAQAVAAGYEPAVCPSAAQVQVVLEAAIKQVDDVAPADHAYDEAQAAVETLRPEADELIQEVMDELRFNLRKLDAPSQRRIMRLYGARFRYLPGEPADPDDEGSE